MLTLTENAQDAVATFSAKADRPVTGLRIAVIGGGCSGLQYGMRLEEAPGEDDVVVDCGRAKVFMTPEHAFQLDGITVDYVESQTGAGFTFENPNASATCGCGKSFASAASCPSRQA